MTQDYKYHTFLLIDGEWTLEGSFTNSDGAYRCGEMNCRLFTAVIDFKVTDRIDYFERLPEFNTLPHTIGTAELLSEVTFVQAETLNGIVVEDAHLEYMYFVDSLPVFITAPDMPTLLRKLVDLNFKFDLMTLANFS